MIYIEELFKIGSTGDIVRKIQTILKEQGYNITVDGIYGPKTELAVREFQKKQKLTVDGIVGPNTLELLFLSYGYHPAEAYINSRNFLSDTKFFIWTNLDTHRVHIFKGSNRNWFLIKSFIASVGAPATPTIKGMFKVLEKGPQFGEKKGYIAKWYTQFHGDYVFHSILYNLNGTVRDGRLGKNISDGCIRLSEAHAKYIYDNIPKGTTVFIN